MGKKKNFGKYIEMAKDEEGGAVGLGKRVVSYPAQDGLDDKRSEK